MHVDAGQRGSHFFFSDHHQLQSSLSTVFYIFPSVTPPPVRPCRVQAPLWLLPLDWSPAATLTLFFQLSTWIFKQQLLHTFTSLTEKGRRSSGYCTSTFCVHLCVDTKCHLTILMRVAGPLLPPCGGILCLQRKWPSWSENVPCYSFHPLTQCKSDFHILII